MKKIINVSGMTKGIFASRYFKAFVIAVMVIMAVMTAILVTVYIDVNKREAEINNSAKNIISQMDKSIDDYRIFEDENGLLGVNGKNDRLIIDASWNDIYILSENRFIVSRYIGENKKMGIIDSESNILVPFVFDTFNSFSNDFIGGFIGSENNFFLFDKYGNLLADKLWTDYKYADKIMYLNDRGSEYRCRFYDNELKFIYADIKLSPGDIPFSMKYTDKEKIENIGFDNINRIADIIGIYLDYLITSNPNSNIKLITTDQYLSSLSSNNFFKDCQVKKISDFSIERYEKKSVESYNVKIIVNYDFSHKNVDVENISSEITLNIIKDENNRLVLKSINKTELDSHKA